MKSIGISKRVAFLVGAALLTSATLSMAQAGSLDPTFGNGGIVTTPNTTTGCGTVVNCVVAIQGDGKIVVAGAATQNNGAPELALARYKTDGSLDPTFGSGGVVVFTESNGGPAFGLAIQTDGKIVTAAPSGLRLDILRYNTNGTLDATFGSGGVMATRAAGLLIGPVPGGLALLSDGRIMVAVGTTLLLFLTNGQLDPSFGTGGVAPLLTSPQTLELLSTGKALVANAFNFSSGSATRYNFSGSLDSTFGVNGQIPSLGQAAAIVTLGNGKFIVAGTLDTATGPSGTPPQGFVLVRYNSNGTIDPTFGTRGAVVTNFPGNTFSAAAAVAMQSNGDIVAAGVTEANNPVFGQEPSDFALARFTPSGQLDATFGNNGLVTTAFGTNGENAAAASALAIQSDGKIVAVGRDNPLVYGMPNNGFTLARYLAQ